MDPRKIVPKWTLCYQRFNRCMEIGIDARTRGDGWLTAGAFECPGVKSPEKLAPDGWGYFRLCRRKCPLRAASGPDHHGLSNMKVAMLGIRSVWEEPADVKSPGTFLRTILRYGTSN